MALHTWNAHVRMSTPGKVSRYALIVATSLSTWIISLSVILGYIHIKPQINSYALLQLCQSSRAIDHANE